MGTTAHTGGDQLTRKLMDLIQRLNNAQQIVEGNLQKPWVRQKAYYDCRVQGHIFKARDKVLVLLPDQNSKILPRWLGSFTVS